MPRRPSGPGGESSPLRRVRLARNWTLEDVVEEIGLRTPGRYSGVTPSMVSGWELGRHTTSIGHRKTLCDIYGQPPDVLFAHQDHGFVGGAPRPADAAARESGRSSVPSCLLVLICSSSVEFTSRTPAANRACWSVPVVCPALMSGGVSP